MACNTSSDSPPCALPPPPSPTTYISVGSFFVIGAGQFNPLQLQLSPATFAQMNGSFTASAGAAVSIMTPAEFANFSASPASFQCPAFTDCFTTGEVVAGEVYDMLPVYQSQQAGQMVAVPWFLVQQNMNSTVATVVTWTTSLVATYIDVYA
ncbi:MAG: hypothetical protein WBW47_03625 [Thermoplasmata archaeon]